jgi:hypothetical protein
MKYRNWHCITMASLIALVGLGLIAGCDSGKEAIDEATGNRAFKQYQKSKKDIEKIAEKQAERYEGIPDNDTEDEKQ